MGCGTATERHDAGQADLGRGDLTLMSTSKNLLRGPIAALRGALIGAIHAVLANGLPSEVI